MPVRTERRSTAAVSVVTLCSAPRVSHVRNQLAGLAAGHPATRTVVWMGDDEPADLDAERIIRLPPGEHGLRLAAARNAGASVAIADGADLLVFLDADCVPGAHMLGRYRAASAAHPDAVLCGPVTYLPAGTDAADQDTLAALTSPHPARPNPPDGEVLIASASEYPLFWSLSFALTAETWTRTGGFHDGYEGYGAEDTDFAFSLRRDGVPLVWVGGAHAYHQHHPTTSPPWQHLDDILRNGSLFAARWGGWPMTGWLNAFAEAGAVHWDGAQWRRTPDAAHSA
ncbi:glycosyltransferase family 2 protein [Microbacterium pygmaeum]|uniref:glycosyltransferase family 2 protein n=1 Tax=Microbacterium pygmaeum TaxID=370764 RepID=UPI000B8A33F6|nr:galactosyltransferase-related protein [Microbacterium pygmaeum]